MHRRRSSILVSLALAAATLFWGVDQGWAQSPKSDGELKYRGGRVTPAERNAAAKRAKALGLKPGVAGKDAAIPTGLQSK